MDFIDELRQFSQRVEGLKENIKTEEATKTSILMPFFTLLGYDVFNPNEFVPEFTADVGIKKGEKVDYAILRDGKPAILVEAKCLGSQLDKHDSQLFRYFGTCRAKFAILTNGIIFKFYTDLEQPNVMDEKPFLEIDILDIKESQAVELKKFTKSNFDVETIFDTAAQLKYESAFKNMFSQELQNPSDEFVKLFLGAVYTGHRTQNIIDKFRPILKKSLNQYINILMNDKIKTALEGSEVIEEENDEDTDISVEPEQPREKKIITTEEELEGYFIVKNLLKELVPVEDITYRDTESYMNVLYQDNRRKWICRFIFTENQLALHLPDKDKNIDRYNLSSLYDLENYKEQLTEVLKRYI